MTSSVHGTKRRYSAGCRCGPCTAANAAYQRELNRRHGRGWISADEVRAHLCALKQRGLGVPSIAAASDVSPQTIRGIRSGTHLRLCVSTARRLLAVDENAAGDKTCIDAGPTWRLLREMFAVGLTRREIAERLGRRAPKFRIARRVHARTALRVRRLHAEVMQGAELDRAASRICLECGHSHASEDRHRALTRLLPGFAGEIRDVHPCWWGGGKGSAGEQQFYRDLHAVGAVGERGFWRLSDSRRAA